MDFTDESTQKSSYPLLQHQGTEVVPPGHCSNLHALANCLALLIGLGVLASPYAVARGGWVSSLVNGLVAVSYFYTGLLLTRCLEDDPELISLSDISRKALGRIGYGIATTLLFVDFLSALVGYAISLSDNLVSVVPNGSQLKILGLEGRYFLTFLATFVLIPTVWVRTFESLAWVSASSLVSSVLVLIALVGTASLEKLGIKQPSSLLHWEGMPIASGIYLFAYGASVVLPSIRASMVNKSAFPKVLAFSMAITATLYGGICVFGASMFGSETESRNTHNMPLGLIASNLAIWANIITSIMKFSILLRPVTVELEGMLPCHADSTIHALVSMGMRTLLVILLTVVSLCLPFFAYVISFVGSSPTITLCLTLPCWMYWRLFRSSIRDWELALIGLLAIGGAGAGVIDIITSFVEIHKSCF